MSLLMPTAYTKAAKELAKKVKDGKVFDSSVFIFAKFSPP